MEFRRETHISTKRTGTQKAARIQIAQRDQEWHESPCTAPFEGPQKPFGLDLAAREIPCWLASISSLWAD